MHVDRRLSEEEERVDYYLDFSTRKRLIEVTERCFIADYVDTFVQKGTRPRCARDSVLPFVGTDSLLNDNKKPELALMYSLLSRVKEGHAVLKNHFSAYVKVGVRQLGYFHDPAIAESRKDDGDGHGTRQEPRPRPLGLQGEA